MSTRESREAALRRLVGEARAEEHAPIDWSGVEERLAREIRRAPPVIRSRPTYPVAWALLAAAGVVAVGLLSQRARVTPLQRPTAALRTDQSTRQSGDDLAPGSRVVAEQLPVSVEHAGRVTWTLSPSSSASLVERGERISVRLERGQVLSTVVPSPKPETFVVEAASVRVAVHGTVFRVSLERERVLVEVREGTVVVGPLHGTPQFSLQGPAHADFAADGRSGNVDGRPLGDAATYRAQPPKPALPRSLNTTSRDNVTPLPSAELPSEPSIGDIETGVALIVDATADCFRRHTQSAEGVEITVRTALSLKITSSGAASDVEFRPPLSPDAAACTEARISQIAFAPSKQGTQVTRMLELRR